MSHTGKSVHAASILRLAKDIINKIKLHQACIHVQKPRWEVILSEHGEGDDALI